MGLIPVTGGITTQGHKPVAKEDESQLKVAEGKADLTLDDYDIRSSELARKQRAAVTVEPRADSAWWGKCDASEKVSSMAPDSPAEKRSKEPQSFGPWNYPFDKSECIQLEAPPVGFDTSTLPAGGNVTFYRMHLDYAVERSLSRSSSDRKEQITYEFWIQRDDAGKNLNSGWVAKKETPDFLWKPVPPK